MQQPPTGYGQYPQWSGQLQQPLPPSEQWAQQPYTPYPPQQELIPQQPFPQPGQFQQSITPNPQSSQQPSWQTPLPPKTPKKKSKLFKIVLIAAAVLIVLTVGFVIFENTIGSESTSMKYQTMSQSQYKAITTYTTEENIDKDGNNDKGKDVHFLCQIVNFVKDSNGNTSGANVDGNSHSGFVQVTFPANTNLTKLIAGDTLEVWGVDEGTFSGNNAFGATVQEVVISAAYMTDVTTTYDTGQ